MKIFEDKGLTGTDLEMHKWLTDLVSEQIEMLTDKMLAELDSPPDYAELQEVKQIARYSALRGMPGRLQLMKVYLVQTRLVNLCKEQAEADPENVMLKLRHDAEESARWALSRYLHDTEIEDDSPPCHCPRCEAARQADADQDDLLRSHMSFDSATVLRSPEEGRSGAYVMPADKYKNGEIPDDALSAPVTHAWRCDACKAILMAEEPCQCGGKRLNPIVIVDLPVDEMNAVDNMQKAEQEHAAELVAGNKVVH